MTSTSRVYKTRQEAAKLGRKRKEYLVTIAEHDEIKKLIKAMRR